MLELRASCNSCRRQPAGLVALIQAIWRANVEAGTKYLSWLLKRFNGDVKLALAGYNAGEGAVDKYNGVPPYNETQNYVRKIVADYGKTFHPVMPQQKLQRSLLKSF